MNRLDRTLNWLDATGRNYSFGACVIGEYAFMAAACLVPSALIIWLTDAICSWDLASPPFGAAYARDLNQCWIGLACILALGTVKDIVKRVLHRRQ